MKDNDIKKMIVGLTLLSSALTFNMVASGKFALSQHKGYKDTPLNQIIAHHAAPHVLGR